MGNAHAAPVPKGKIVYVSFQNGSNDVFAMNGDGSRKINLSRSATSDLGPKPSPDGQKVLFFAHSKTGSSLRVVKMDGTPLVRFRSASRYFNAYWSPDGRKIAFSSYSSAQGHRLCVANADGSELVTLSHGAGSDVEVSSNVTGSWSPDSMNFVFDGRSNGSPYVLLASVDGTVVRSLSLAGQGGQEPQWSPDGRRIAFLGTNKSRRCLYVVGALEGQPRVVSGRAAHILKFLWSPDGRKIAFLHYSPTFNGQLGIADASTNQPLLSGMAIVAAPLLWKPDSTQVLVQVRRRFVQDIYFVNAQTAASTRFTDSPEAENEANWSPDGRYLAYMVFQDGRHQIFVTNANGTRTTNISNSLTDDSAPQWTRGELPASAQSATSSSSSAPAS